jgi:thiamine transport system substrate-binding protein
MNTHSRPHPTRFRTVAALLLVLTLIASACAGSDDATDTPEQLTLLAHGSFALSDGTLAAFTERTGIAVNVLDGGDAGTMLNRAILTKGNPIADVIFGIDNTFISRAVNNELLVPHTAADIDKVDGALRLEGDIATPVTFGDVCINYDIAGLADAALDPPTGLADLTAPAYRGMLAVQDPATSSPGLAFLMATVASYPDGAAYDWKKYWADLFANDVAVASDWSEAYYTLFSIAGGDRPLVVSYASSPPAEVLFGELSEPPTGVMTEACFRQVEYAGILAGTRYPEAAGELVDFLLTTPVQEDIPLNMFVYPTNREADLPAVFVDHTIFPEAPLLMEPTVIEQNRERWIKEWTDIARSR